ncbi:MAG: type II secretion system GspH family protein [Gemmataceae bacterium]|nr:type II secretion system GspH family protein [Gemmataceae bacterium]
MIRRCGYSLVEMLVVIGGLVAMMSLSSVLLISMQNLQKTVREDEEHVRMNTSVADRLREDVGHALALLDRETGFQSGPDCVILKMPGNRVVVWRTQSNEAVRREFGPGDLDVRTAMPLGGEGASATFVPDPAGRKVVLRLHGMRDAAGRTQARTIEIVAAVGGDRP